MAASSSSSLTALRTLRTLQSRWPADPLRPTLQFSAALESALGRIEQQGNLTRSQQEQKAVEMGNALQRLLNDEALNRYPLSPRTLSPPSFPKHYNRIKEGVAKAARGEIIKPPSWRSRFFEWR